MNRGAKLAVLTASLAVLIGAWFLAKSMSGRREADVAAAEETESIDIAVGAYEDVTALSWNYFGNTVSIAYDSEKDTWVNTEDDTFPVSAEAVEPLVRAVSSAVATVEVTDVTDFEQYGLDDPAITVMAATADNIVTYGIGNTTLTGEYYVRVNDTDSVYTETGVLAPAFQAQLADILAVESVPADIASVTALAVDTDVGAYEVEYRPDGEAFWYTDAYTWFLDGEDGTPSQPLEEEQVQALYGLATEIQFLSCDTWDAKSLTPYGLDEPQGVVRVEYQDQNGDQRSFTLEFGDYTSDGHVYVRLSGSRMVYLASGTALDGLMYPDWTAMTPLSVCPLNWTWLESVEVKTAETQTVIVRSQTTPMGEDEEPEDIFTAGDRSLDGESVSSWLENIALLTADSVASGAEGRSEQFQFIFRQNSEVWPEVTLAFWDYDSAHYLCVLNGEPGFLVLRTEADALVEEAQAFLTPQEES